jgi:Protein of unknown function (DUF4031)
MTVYVDDANIPASIQNGNRTHTSLWCHLSADTEAELHDFAARLGLKRAWFQHAGRPTFHYDLTAGKRAQAVAQGATQITYHQMGELAASRRAAAPAPAPNREVSGPALADKWAAQARQFWTDGNLAHAAAYNFACQSLDPSRASLWLSRADKIREAASRLPLAEATQVRLITAGFRRDSPDPTRVREHNAEAAGKAPADLRKAEPEAAA